MRDSIFGFGELFCEASMVEGCVVIGCAKSLSESGVT